MDGELAEHQEQVLFAALRQDDELRGCWLEYQLVGDALKGERDLGTELTGRVMAALDAEPTVLAPRISHRDPWHRPALALAATLAGIAVVGWLALNTGQSARPVTVAQESSTPREPVMVAAAVQPVREDPRHSLEMQEYLVAHEAQSSALQFRGGAEHIRTVAIIGMATSK